MYVLNNEIEELNNLSRILEKKKDAIPYSEFWTEVITGFSSSDVKSVRNWTKIFNGLQLLSLLFIATILINSVNNNLGLKKVKTKNLKKKKSKKNQHYQK